MDQNGSELPPPQQISVKRCRSCDGEIIWASTVRGSRIPLNAQHTIAYVLEGPRVGGSPQAIQKRVYVTHFATCPKAKEHRKPRPAGRVP